MCVCVCVWGGDRGGEVEKGRRIVGHITLIKVVVVASVCIPINTCG